MGKWGLGYADLVKLKPDIIMVSISLYGQTGPYSRRGGWGSHAEGMSGFWSLIGWPDRAPTSFQTVIGDALLPFFALSALTAALEYRDKTGKGQHLDLCQLDILSYLLSPLALDLEINGREATRCGSRSPTSCPHNVYPCLGEDQWCAITVSDDGEWRRLCRAIGASQL